ncbi:MAG: AAA family ATPase [Aromatoleum sp.]|jgi:SpoVK/Ycf46/Vps4 family AAA+-type ATPase|uniref:AAA family ATPase n=1 Tax=Aromatoleum sp. TaxID=2307007 RepID=UPI0028942D6E|nr:AAA family ATPase [Aromatoleum sp.]MDT3670868.1 AAA family ATPase [Aromatoleum sp.]
MNADILKRVVRAIANGSQPDLDRLAGKIVEAERKTGHVRLADQLEAILKQPKPKPKRPVAPLSAPDIERTLKELPLSRRHGETLATLIPHERLEHHMVLPEAVEQRFARIEAEYAARDRLRIFGLKPRKTVLLYGPPGCGKSLGAKRLAWNTGLPLMKVRFDVLISSFFGESAQNLRSIFSSAREKPCVLLLDECDFIARSRTASKDIGEVARIVNSLLQLMEDYEAPGLLVATTNLESALDPALFRRFDDVFSVPLPGPTEIEKLLKLALSSMRMDNSIDWKHLVAELQGSSAAMVVKAAQDAAKATVLGGHSSLSQDKLLKAVEELQRHDTGQKA